MVFRVRSVLTPQNERTPGTPISTRACLSRSTFSSPSRARPWTGDRFDRSINYTAIFILVSMTISPNNSNNFPTTRATNAIVFSESCTEKFVVSIVRVPHVNSVIPFLSFNVKSSVLLILNFENLVFLLKITSFHSLRRVIKIKRTSKDIASYL